MIRSDLLELEMTSANVQHQLDEEDHINTASGSLPLNETTATTFLVMGFDLEHQQ